MDIQADWVNGAPITLLDAVATLTVTDNSGNSSQCSAVFTVEDKVAPSAQCQSATISFNISGNASLAASDVDNNSTDNCGIDSRAVSPNSFSCASGSSQTTTLTVTDDSGNTASCTAAVTLTDPLGACCTAPVANCKNATIGLDENGMYILAASEVDNGSSADCGLQSITVSPNTFNCNDVGNDVTVILTITDAKSAQATCTSSVSVLDEIAPTALCSDLTINLDMNGLGEASAGDLSVGSSDNCHIQTTSINPSTFNCANEGNNVVTLTLGDAAGNTSNCTANVLVNDPQLACCGPPQAVCMAHTVMLNASGMGSLTASDVDGGSSAACGLDDISANPTSFDCNDIGNNNVVTLIISDINEESSSCTAQVTVVDPVPPTALCSFLTLQLNPSGQANIAASNYDGGSVDNCGDVTFAASATSFDCRDAQNRALDFPENAGIDVANFVATPVDINPSVVPTLTMEAWINSRHTNLSFNSILSSEVSAGQGRGLKIVRGSFNVRTGTANWETGINAPTNTWVHVAVVYTATDIIFYLNGVPTARGSAETITTSPGNLTMGNRAERSWQAFFGTIDEVRIWNTARSASETQSNRC